MENYRGAYKPTKTTAFIINFNKYVFFLGLPNYWIEEFDFPAMFVRFYSCFNKFGNWAVYGLLVLEYLAVYFLKNLNDQQNSTLILFIISHTIVIVFLVRMIDQEVQIRDVMYKLGIALKEAHNDSEAERRMIKKSTFFLTILQEVLLDCSIKQHKENYRRVDEEYVSSLLDHCFRDEGETFNIIITAWPDMEDRSVVANIGRVVIYVVWWIYVMRLFSVYSLVIFLTIAISHQFMNLKSYVYNLSNIFEDDQLTQREKEHKYEEALKVGINLHSETLKCTHEIQVVCRDAFSGQIIFNITLLIVLMFQMMNSARNLTSMLPIVVTALSILCSTGFFMWNAGDITVEAQSLPTAMFSSGWENCRHEASVRVRKLLVLAMMQAQTPVVLTGLGIIALSYQSYVSIVKSSYSVFSVLF